MSSTSNTPGRVEPAGTIVKIGPDRLQDAVAGLLAYANRDNHGGARRFLDYALENQVSLESMWSLVDEGGRIRATVLGVPSPGHTAMLFATHPPRLDDVRAIAPLIDHACRGLRTCGVDLAQALLDPGDHLAKSAYLEADFILLAQLSYMQRPIRASDASLHIDWPDGISLERYLAGSSDRAELVSLLEESYIDTLDCPGLVGLRDAEDILTGHESVGDPSQHVWLMVREGGSAVGVVMLNPPGAGDTAELVYLGLAPRARGRRLGAKLLRAGLAQLAHARLRTVTLAVDQRNRPAVMLYEREGFRVVLERLALIRSLRGVETA